MAGKVLRLKNTSSGFASRCSAYFASCLFRYVNLLFSHLLFTRTFLRLLVRSAQEDETNGEGQSHKPLLTCDCLTLRRDRNTSKAKKRQRKNEETKEIAGKKRIILSTGLEALTF